MKRKKILIVAAIAVVVALSACRIIVKGGVYIGYGWDNILDSFYDENPSIRNVTVYEDTYYPSNEGSYWVSYEINFSGTIIFRYTLTADEGYFLGSYRPADAFFYIYLRQSGPIIYSPIYRSLSGESGAKGVTKAPAPTGKALSSEQIEALGAPTGVLEKTENGYTMHLEYWKVE